MNPHFVLAGGHFLGHAVAGIALWALMVFVEVGGHLELAGLGFGNR